MCKAMRVIEIDDVIADRRRDRFRGGNDQPRLLDDGERILEKSKVSLIISPTKKLS